MRLLALLIIVFPGIIATLGIKLMRDAIFGDFYNFFFHVIIQFFSGLVMFLAGLAFIGGFIFYRDNKRNRTKGKSKQHKRKV